MALPENFWGAVPQSNLSTEQLNRIDRGGVESIRVAFEWGSLQPQKGEAISWAETDAVIERAAKAGIEPGDGDRRPALGGAVHQRPQRRRRQGAGAPADQRRRPLRLEAVPAPGGPTLRAGRRLLGDPPGSPERPVRVWQIWNEPNFKYFVAKPNPKEYGKLVKLSYAASAAPTRAPS